MNDYKREVSLVVLCIKRCDLNSCIVIFCNLKFCSESVVSDIVIIKFSVKQKKNQSSKTVAVKYCKQNRYYTAKSC